MSGSGLGELHLKEVKRGDAGEEKDDMLLFVAIWTLRLAIEMGMFCYRGVVVIVVLRLMVRCDW